MKERGRLSKFLRFFRHGEKGFTLVELLVALVILGIMGGVVTMNIGGFIGIGQEEAKTTEGQRVQTAAVCYLADGNTISKSFIVGPKSQGVLDYYLIGNLMYRWIVDTDGGVNPAGPGPKPKPKPEPVGPKPGPGPIQPAQSCL